MSDTSTPATPTPGAPVPAPRRSRTRKLALVAAVVVGLPVVAIAAGKAMGHGPGFGHGWHGRGGFMHGAWGGPIDPQRAEERVDKMLRHMAVEVDATPEQTAKLSAIGKAAARDILPMREKLRDVRTQARDMLLGATVDRAQIEKLRADQLANADSVSKRLTQALADAAEVLTPEQRKKLAERMEERRGRWGGPMGGR